MATDSSGLSVGDLVRFKEAPESASAHTRSFEGQQGEILKWAEYDGDERLFLVLFAPEQTLWLPAHRLEKM